MIIYLVNDTETQMNNIAKLLRYLFIGVFLIIGPVGKAQKPYYGKSNRDWQKPSRKVDVLPVYTVYLIGDAGEPDFTKPSALKVLEGHLSREDSNSIVVFLGDNIYPAGMPMPGASNIDEAETKINAQLDILKAFQGKIVFVSGNHDWDHWSPDGLESIRREEEYVEKYLGKGNTFLPDEGCPGPVVINLAKDIVLIAIDTQWWLHKWTKVDKLNKHCLAIDDSTFIGELDAALSDNQGKQIIVVAHHPIITNGNHGGHFTWKDHIFPLTAKYHKLYIPLPILGSIYPMGRKLFKHIQDLPNPRYRLMATKLESVFLKYDNLIYATGHDHNLQYLERGGQHYIISGAGAKTTNVAKGHDASFTYARQGFMKLQYFADHSMWLEAWVTNQVIDSLGHIAYQKQLLDPTIPAKVR